MLRIVGDCNFADGFFDVGFGTGSKIKKGANPFQHIKEDGTTDYWIGNLECVCSDVSNKVGIEAKQFVIAPDDCKSICHLDFYGVANNHVMQHGADAYHAMVDYLEKNGVKYAGTRERRSSTFEHQGKKISVTVFNQRPENFTKPPLYWAMPEYEEVKKELKAQQSDFRIVYVHWGVEFINYPYNDQKQFAHFLVDCGADLVIGMHPHVIQGFEEYKGKYIFYSLGNCVFNMPWEPTKFSLMVNVDLTSGDVSYQYLHIGKDYYPAYADSVPEKYQMEYLNNLLDICEEDENYFIKAHRALNEYRKANRKEILRSVFKMKITDSTSMLIDFVKRNFQ